MLSTILTYIYDKLTRSYISLHRKCAFESTAIDMEVTIEFYHISLTCVRQEATLMGPYQTDGLTGKSSA